MLVLVALFMAGAEMAVAQESLLTALYAALVPLRAQPQARPEVRGASPQFTTLKHQLRDWVESRLVDFPQRGSEAALAQELNAVLLKAELTCSTNRGGPAEYCSSESFVGYLETLRVTRQQEFLIVETGMGIICGYDESAYLYRWNGSKWQRLWSSEQTIYTEKQYVPQTIHAVQISPVRAGQKQRLVLTLGSNSWCSSNWHPVYYRLWRIGGEQEQMTAPLIDRKEMAFLGKNTPPISATLKAQELTVEFSALSIDPSVHSRNAVRRFTINGSRARRVAPIAITPRNFVEEWLTLPWMESRSLSNPSSLPALQKWHKRFFTGGGEFTAVSKLCKGNGDEWQVSLRVISPIDKTEPPHYFLVRWRKPHSFALMQISDQAWDNCLIADAQVDEYRTLLTH